MSVDEAYLEFIIPMPQPQPLPQPHLEALDHQHQNQHQKQQYLASSSPIDESDTYPLEFGLAKASELRQKILMETGCTAR